MNAKKTVSLLLALVMIFSLAACGGGSTTESAAPTKAATPTKAADNPGGNTTTDEPYAVQLLLPTMQTIPAEEEIKRVEDAINDHIKNDLGITDIKMDLRLGSLFDYTTSTSMGLASGERYDILYTGPLYTAVTNGYLVDLTDMLDNELAPALGVLPKDWIRSGMIDGRTYAVPCYKGQVLSWKYIFDEDVYGDVVDWSTIHSLDDLDAIMPKLKAAAPNERPYVYNNQNVNLEWFKDHVSAIGTYAATVGDSTQLVNIFETDAFKRGCEMAYRWSQAGYSDPEGSTNTLTHDAIIMSGQSKGVMMGHAYSIETIEKMFTSNNTYGGKFKAVEIGVSDMSTNTLTYGIAYTSGNPSAAARMLSLIWTDEFIASALIYGVEGVSYVWNADHTSIVYPDGLDLNTVPYTALYTCGAFGNQFLLYGMDANTSEADKDFMKDLIDNAWYPPLFGFIPNSEPVSTQVAAVSNVYDQYYKVLTYGDVDPAEFLPRFLQELKAAGIDDIIAEYQTQVDKWLTTVK